MIVIEKFPHWMITSIDQSVAAAGTVAGTYGPQDRGVWVEVTCSGPRYARWRRAVHEGDYTLADDIQIFVQGQGHTFEDAKCDVEGKIQEIESTPIPD